MCGICGLIHARRAGPRPASVLTGMNAAMVHRGPDGAGEFSADTSGLHVQLAMRRLSIIDLGGGAQPLYNEDRSIALVANGEIYNYVELRSALESRGHHFRSGSDCECIIHAYEENDREFIGRLRGMFAFALWDSRRQCLLIARDRMGEKPLYLYEAGETLIFASEMKAMLASGLVPFELDPAAVDEYMHFGWVPEPRTVVRGVRKLTPGHVLTLTGDPWTLDERCYWRFAQAEPVAGEPAQLIRTELNEISRLIVRSDVPVGVALSGGVDSSAVAALAVRHYPGVIQAFSVGYQGRPAQDERAMAKAFAEYLGVPFHEIELSLEEMVASFEKLNFWRDDPIADIAGFGYYALSRAARQHGCPVLIQGQGGDELNWGYAWSVAAVHKTIAKAGGRRASWLAEFARSLPTHLSRSQLVQFAYLMGGIGHGWKRLRPGLGAPEDHIVFYDLCDSFQKAQSGVHETYTPQFKRSLGEFDPAAFFRLNKPWPRPDLAVMELLCRSYLLQNGIAQGDRLSMANSVELRLPLVDFRLVELMVGLQKSNPSYVLPPKQWLKDAVSDVVPEWVLNRQKRGFNPPVTLWTEAIRATHGRSLENGMLVNKGILKPEVLPSLLRKRSRFGIWNDLFFKFVTLENWCRSMQPLAAAASR